MGCCCSVMVEPDDDARSLLVEAAEQESAQTSVGEESDGRKRFHNRYRLGPMLGEGANARVYAAVRRHDDRPVAVKYMPAKVNKRRIGPDNLPTEVVLLQMLQDVNGVIRLLDYGEIDSHSFYLVLERPIDASDLFDYIDEHGVFTENEAKRLFVQIVDTTLQCHLSGVVHGDIKLENMLVVRDGKLVPKLIDFGNGWLLKEDEIIREFRGTVNYIPPEWFSQNGYKAEPFTVWMLGHLLYDMLHASSPFEDAEDIQHGKFHYSDRVSALCNNLMALCLAKDPAARPTIQQVRDHRWFIFDCECEAETPLEDSQPCSLLATNAI